MGFQIKSNNEIFYVYSTDFLTPSWNALNWFPGSGIWNSFICMHPNGFFKVLEKYLLEKKKRVPIIAFISDFGGMCQTSPTVQKKKYMKLSHIYICTVWHRVGFQVFHPAGKYTSLWQLSILQNRLMWERLLPTKI